MKAVVVQEGRTVAIQDHPVPQPRDDDILVKTVAIAQNPTDYKFVDFGRGKPGTVLGCDWSGHVVKVGKNVTTPKVGEHVAGFVMGATFVDSGAFAEYVKTPAELSWVVPDGTFTHEEAATMGCAFWTAVQALFHPTRLALVEPPEKTAKEEWVYIHGGSSAVGQFAIQLAVLAGYKVVTTASPHNFALVGSLGASAVFDYKEPDVVTKIKAATGDTIRSALDTISLRETQEISAAVIAPGGGKVMHILGVIPEASSRTDVERSYTLLYWALGRAFSFGPGNEQPVKPEDRAHMVQFLNKLPTFAKEGKVKPLPIKLWEGGLEAVPAGLQYMREGKVSAEKIVYRV
ncbi:GroES-like protein [Trametes elegans]|nr:GroES-like protein [Trametes elegans]